MGKLVSRRTALLGAGAVVAAGAAGVAGVEQGVLPGRTRLHRALGLEGEDGHIPDVRPGRVVSGSFVSQARGGTETGWSVVYPTAVAQPLPVLVSLHGLGGDHRSAIDGLGIDRFLVAAVRSGVAPFAVATVDGGTTYWHPRPDGEDAGAMVTDELLPILARQGLRTDRLAFGGWSMGGYGALRLAGLLGADRVSAVGAMSAALWTDAADASPSGFDDAAEYEQYSVLGHQDDLRGIGVRLDCGTDDPFYEADHAYVDGFDFPVTSSFQPGAHTTGYWQRVLPAQLAFVGSRLA